jgi:hypothetical protein
MRQQDDKPGWQHTQDDQARKDLHNAAFINR